MRTSPTLLLLVLSAALLAGCGQKSQTSDQTAVTAPAPAEGPTPAQANAILATLPAPYNTADLANGKHIFAQCAACHTAEQGGPNMTGPNLYGVFGRKAATHEGFNYSQGLAATGITWDAPQIDHWITNPRAVAPDTRMSFMGLKDPKDRIDVVGYLKVRTTPPGP